MRLDSVRLWFVGVAVLSLLCTSCGCGSGAKFKSSAGGAGGASAAGGASGGVAGTGHGGVTGGGVANGGGGGVSGGAGAGGAGGQSAECSAAADCTAVRGGPAACGTWDCVGGQCTASSPGCTDADHDGYGAGATCACAGGIDCDDTDPAFLGSGTRSCYTGKAGTEGIGVCHAGTETCVAGVLGPCVGEVTPTGEACNGEDDDCNGTKDDGMRPITCGVGACRVSVPACDVTNAAAPVPGVCVPGTPATTVDDANCASPNGIDDDCDGLIDEDCTQPCVAVLAGATGGTGTFASPLGTIAAGIAAAQANGQTRVCVAGGASCAAQSYTESVTMVDGISVEGSYNPTGTTWPRCTGLPTSRIVPAAGQTTTVTFPNSVSQATKLDGFYISRATAGTTTTGILIDGAKNVFITDVYVDTQPSLTETYGIDLANGADAVIRHGRVDAGFGDTAIAIRSVGSRVTVENMCDTFDAKGHCTTACGAQQRFVRGRNSGVGTVSYGILLDDSPGSVIQAAAICANSATTGATVKIINNAKNVVVRGSFIQQFGGVVDSHGIWMEDCGGEAPWIVDNDYIVAGGVNQQTRVDGVRSVGDCHAVVDSNVQITGGSEGNAANPTGVHCLANASQVPSRCAVLGNPRIEGSRFGFPPVATGVRCDDKSCVRVAHNTITGRGGMVSYGVYLDRTGAVVNSNIISGGCSPDATGINAVDAFSRIQNNRVFGATASDCAAGTAFNPTQSRGLRVETASGSNEVDVHSNDFDAAGSSVACTGYATQLVASTTNPPSAASGIFRNNILRAGQCLSARYDFYEGAVTADPRLLEHNDFDPFNTPTALYFDEATTAYSSAANIDQNAGGTGSLDVDALFVNAPTDLHLQSTSPCIGAGTPAGAPAFDMEGTPRDPATPDIGADEN